MKSVNAETQLIISMTFCLFLAGCIKEEYTEVRVLNGGLRTPWGEYEFENIPNAESAREFSVAILGSRTDFREILVADSGRKMMFLLDLSSIGYLTVGINKREWVNGEAVDNKEKTRIFVEREKTKICHRDECSPFIKKSMDILRNRGYSSWSRLIDGESSTRAIYRAYQIKVEPLSVYNEKFSIDMPFEISNEKFRLVLDVKKVKKSRLKLKVGIPATP